jgi:hypothetical protein
VIAQKTTGRAEREREIRAEVRRLKAALSGIHDRLHAGDVDGAHELCECALAGDAVSQPNLTVAQAARGMDFAARFNALAGAAGLRACAVVFEPSATVPGAASIQLCGNVAACKVLESMIRGEHSTYMGDHQWWRLDAESAGGAALREIGG